MLYILSLVVQQIGTNFGEAIKLFLSGSISLVQLMERIKCAALNGARESIRIALELKDTELKMNRSNSLAIVNINRERTIIGNSAAWVGKVYAIALRLASSLCFRR